MENLPKKNEKECCGQPSTSAFEGKTFIITPDKIARMGLIEQIKNVYNAQVASKASQDVPDTIKTKTRIKLSESKFKVKHTGNKDQLDIKDSTDCINVRNDKTLLVIVQTPYQTPDLESLSSITLDSVGQDAALNKRRNLSVKRKKSESVNSTTTFAEDQTDKNNTPMLDNLRFTTTKETGKSSETYDRQLINNNIVGAEVANKQLCHAKRNTTQTMLINKNTQSHVKLGNDLKRTNDKEVSNQKVVVSRTNELSDTDLINKSENIAEVTFKKRCEEMQQCAGSTLTYSTKSTDSMPITDVKCVNITSSKSNDVLLSDLNCTITSSETTAGMKDIKNVNTPTVLAAAEHTLNKIHVLSIEPVFLPEKDLKVITQSVVRDKIVSQLSQTGDTKNNKTTQITTNINLSVFPAPSNSVVTNETVLNLDNDTTVSVIKKRGRRKMSDLEKSIATKEIKIPEEVKEPEKVVVLGKKRIRRQNYVSEFITEEEVKEPEKVVVLGTKRIPKKKKFESEFITDEEYEVAMEMAETQSYSCTPVNKSIASSTKKRGYKKKCETIAKTELNVAADVTNGVNMFSITKLPGSTESDIHNLASISNTTTVKTESLDKSVSSIESEICVQDALEVLSRVDHESQSAVQMDVPSCLTVFSLNRFCAPQENS